ncbi:hypothetical protein L917_04849 [Phytophthora nicotianae]|uniref:Uncharacterized protein n=1 Tax=Phytophthora nicotianae TaxID=4792 RepID=W2LKN5_PHYNI|nr:hypothetical protein L915_05002 [Phytophthora nicotianae]ETL44806.1 hypothetical protein L916_04950 [Phytophthora nicotianae]ETL97961.1 hypothetical protein L917_04849 [Phytophthora nicotianae]
MGAPIALRGMHVSQEHRVLKNHNSKQWGTPGTPRVARCAADLERPAQVKGSPIRRKPSK